jgi:hypothetical protein
MRFLLILYAAIVAAERSTPSLFSHALALPSSVPARVRTSRPVHRAPAAATRPPWSRPPRPDRQDPGRRTPAGEIQVVATLAGKSEPGRQHSPRGRARLTDADALRNRVEREAAERDELLTALLAAYHAPCRNLARRREGEEDQESRIRCRCRSMPLPPPRVRRRAGARRGPRAPTWRLASAAGRELVAARAPPHSRMPPGSSSPRRATGACPSMPKRDRSLQGCSR